MKKIKGFTLVECLVALAILGISSLIMAQIYANISRINRENNYYNQSLANQVKYSEKTLHKRSVGTDTTAFIEIAYSDTNTAGGKIADDTDPRKAIPTTRAGFATVDSGTVNDVLAGIKSETSDPYIAFVKAESYDSTNKVWNAETRKYPYSFAIDLYVLNNRDENDNVATDIDHDGSTADDNHYLSYKYFLPNAD